MEVVFPWKLVLGAFVILVALVEFLILGLGAEALVPAVIAGGQILLIWAFGRSIHRFRRRSEELADLAAACIVGPEAAVESLAMMPRKPEGAFASHPSAEQRIEMLRGIVLNMDLAKLAQPVYAEGQELAKSSAETGS